MPAYAPSDNPAQNQLSKRDIGLLVDWLRGEWYEERVGLQRIFPSIA